MRLVQTSIAGRLLILTLGVVGCSRSSDAPQTRRERPELSEAVRSVVEVDNRLAVQLYRELRREGENLAFSPYSIATALAMTSVGAAGITRDEIDMVFGITTENERDRFHAAQRILLEDFNHAAKDRGYQLNIANRLWVQSGKKLLDPFVETLDQQYQSGLERVDFVENREATRDKINAWAEKHTQGKIREVIPPGVLNDFTRLVLTNAVYFKGDWEHAFEKSSTKEQPFYLTASEKVNVPLMYQRDRFGFMHEDGVRVLVMPYRGGQVSMVMILPDKIDGLGQLEESLQYEMLEKWIATAAENPLELPVWLPRFRIEQEFSLAEALRSMGIKQAFDATAADFSGIDGIMPDSSNAGAGLFLQHALHKVYVDVNEEGTEAAAVTTMTTTEKSEMPKDPPRFRADHPFLFAIRDDHSGTILFLGRVIDPR